MKVDFSKVKYHDELMDSNGRIFYYLNSCDFDNECVFVAPEHVDVQRILLLNKDNFVEPKQDIEKIDTDSFSTDQKPKEAEINAGALFMDKLNEIIDRVNADRSHWVKASDFLKLRESVIYLKSQFLDLADRVNELSRGDK